MNYLIDTITGCPEGSLNMELIQKAIDELNEALHEALKIRDDIKEGIHVSCSE